MTSPLRLAILLMSGLVFWSCDVSESGGPDTLTFRLDDSLKISGGKYDSVQLDLYTISGKDTSFRRILFRGIYSDPAQLEKLSMGDKISGDFLIRVIAYREHQKILEVGVPFIDGQASPDRIVYKAPSMPPINNAPVFISGLGNVSMPERETRQITIKAKDMDGDPIRFSIQNLDSLRSLFPNGVEAITVFSAGDSLLLTFSPGSASGNYPFRIALYDSIAPSVVQTVIISVGKVNRPPALS